MSTQADWDLTPYFEHAQHLGFSTFVDTLNRDLIELRAKVQDAAGLDSGTSELWAGIFLEVENVHVRFSHLSSYLGCAGAADAKDEVIKKAASDLSTMSSKVRKLFVSLESALRDASDANFEALCQHETLKGAEYYLERMRKSAKRSMDVALEELNADLTVTGIEAWGRLYNQISGNLTFEMQKKDADADADDKVFPAAMTRTLLEDGDRETRRLAFDGAAKAWSGVADSVAASLNAISGTRLTLYRRRGQKDFLEQPLFDAGIKRETLSAMFAAVRSRQSLPRDYLKHKASLLGVKKLAYYDLMAPLNAAGQSDARIPWKTARSFVERSFHEAVPELGELASQAFEKRWIDHTPRQGKRPGGFCSSSHLIGESRIFMTYNGASGDVQTLAHEIGHAYHNYVMRDMRPWARKYPMPLAETASTFAENITTTAVLSDPATTRSERISILGARLQDAEAFMLNIPMRFDFESELYKRRAEGELSIKELCDMMKAAQIKNYGDAIDHEALDPWFWASKLHFYITGVSFYNFPYTFGYLFSAGLFKRFLDEGPSFLPAYRELLRKTGSAMAEEVVMNAIGEDLTRPDFWNASIDLIQSDWEQLVAI